METKLSFGGIQFSFLSEVELDIDPDLNNFISNEVECSGVTVHINREWDNLLLPTSCQLGEDTICCYYQEGNKSYCLTKGGAKGPVACAIYDEDYKEIKCIINEKPFIQPPKNLGSILRMIPLRAIFQKFGVLFFHASRVCYEEKAILFAAPSGTGKTTQAKLWQKYRNAEILSNDRTLMRKVDDVWYSYGFPMDGSEPVRSNAEVPLGAVVLLAKGSENHIERLRPARASALLMNQSVIDVWNPDARRIAMELILSLQSDIPVYLLSCTPDEGAVETLEEKLKKDGVISLE